MKYNLKLTNNMTYAEEGQRNPIRWKTLLKHEDGSFTDQSGWIKCKDFYNDTVAFFREGSKFSIYGYQNDIKANAEGVYFLLKYISDKASFLSNLEVLNQQLFKDTGETVGHLDMDEKDQVIILLPPTVWETTYKMSLVTMCIRLCNYGYKYKEWADFWKTEAPVYTIEHSFTEAAKKSAREFAFKVPEKFSKYWWYCGEKYNSEVIKNQTGGTIHNNGVSSWSQYMQAAK